MSIKASYLTAKRRLFDIYYGFLNEEQRRAVYTVQGPLLILAGAGSGKTTVLVNRIVYILRYGNAYMDNYVPEGIDEEMIEEINEASSLPREQLGDYLCRFACNPPPAWTLLAITFTNKAAGEIKERISAALGEDSADASDIWSGTFHSICMRILRKYGDYAGYGHDFGICDSDDQKKLALDCMKQLNIDPKQLAVKSVLSNISRAKDHLMTPDDYAAEIGSDARGKQIAKVYFMYQKRLKESNLLDFDDIIMETVRILQKYEDARTYYQNRFRYISVDEYQDTNAAQFELVRLLAGGRRNIMAVGDDDQSIYKFRGATIENILTFDKTYSDAAVIKLEQNYRSTKTILNAANAVIAKNTERKGKELWTDGDEGDAIVLKKLQTQLDEARFLSDQVTEMCSSEKYTYRDFAVLYRTNAQSRSIEQTFAKSGIPYRMLGSLRFFDRAEIRDIIAYLAVVNNPADSIRMRRILNQPRRGIGDKSAETAEAIAVAEGVPLIEVLRKAELYTAIPAAARHAMKLFADFIDGMRAEAEAESISTIIRNLADKSGYTAMIRKMGPEEADRLDNIDELVSTAAQYEENAENPSISEFLEDVALVSDVDRYDETANAVVLMTIHSAKGLEFPVVFLPGMEEGLFPGFQSIMNPSEIEEERRLAYVALTRAKKKLFITHVHERMLNGNTQFNTLSRFVGEIPAELLDSSDETERCGNWSTRTAGGYGGFGGGYGSAGTRSVTTGAANARSYSASHGSSAPSATMPKPQMKKPAALPSFKEGDRVHHATFGDGTVLGAKPLASDILYEINFDKVGTKRLMATFARLTASE